MSNVDKLEWTQEAHNTIVSCAAGYPTRPTQHVGRWGSCEVIVLEGDRGVALTVYTEPQRPPDMGPDGPLCLYGRSCLPCKPRFQSVEEAKEVGADLVIAYQIGRTHGQ